MVREPRLIRAGYVRAFDVSWWPPSRLVFEQGTWSGRLARALASAYTLYHDFKVGRRRLVEQAVASSDFKPLLLAAKCTARELVREYGVVIKV